MDCFVENIPRFEFRTESPDNFTSLARRLICGRVGRGKFVKDASLVDEDLGSFLYIPQADLKEFVMNPLTGALYLKYFLVPGFEKF